MDGNSRHQVIKRLQAGLPRGAPFDLATLSQFGVSPQLAAHYADGGWLVRLAHGVYAFRTMSSGSTVR
ncbi:transcriptional regulator with AbiEi antitoxin domain of type IV toxin-antitoxin system [Sinimarinibacterium flocculans]|uniref:Transcriptional regulator with AbiEi antitoxin domain of type IV toxin-antitoxin system n=1 Tax=Sinimarinibacterium flocculans TaxID=985250 RepID=A0A318E3D3_9GAMM|nr:transcriptional regulator with AbiEi antitoxin domain of type IV toxin-antitoxin system [Sinimarinibacterium flocculans]